MPYLYTVFDSKANAFLPPFTAPTDLVAQRMVGDACKDATHPWAMHPGDYTLYAIGKWDEVTGDITPAQSPVALGTCLQLTGGNGSAIDAWHEAADSDLENQAGQEA